MNWLSSKLWAPSLYHAVFLCMSQVETHLSLELEGGSSLGEGYRDSECLSSPAKTWRSITGAKCWCGWALQVLWAAEPSWPILRETWGHRHHLQGAVVFAV